MLVIFIALQIRIFSFKEDNIYNKLIKDDMTSGNYDNAQNIVKQTINKNYADDQTYYLSGMIMATINSKSEGCGRNGSEDLNVPKSGLLNFELAIANRSLNDDEKALKYVRKALNADPKNTIILTSKRLELNQMSRKINNFYDVQQLLKSYGFLIYFKNPEDMYEMIQQEISSLYQYELLSKEEYLKCTLIINQRRNEQK